MTGMVLVVYMLADISRRGNHQHTDVFYALVPMMNAQV
jgi:hypothetical protein